MSEFRIDKITNRDGSGGTQIAGITTFSGTSGMVMPGGPTKFRGGRGRGFVLGGQTNQSFDKVEMATAGNAIDFGDMTTKGQQLGACASSTRAVWGGQATNPDNSPYMTNNIDYITMASTGHAWDFGDFTDETLYERQAGGNETRGIFWGGGSPATMYRKYQAAINIASKGDTYDWGDLQNPTGNQRVSISSPTRSVVGNYQSGYDGARNVIEYVTISTYGSATDFGSVDQYVNGERSGSSNSTRGIFAGNWNPGGTNAILYITIATTGHGTDFGDLLTASNQASSMSSSTRCLVNSLGGGNVIQHITITTTGNAADFGDLTANRGQSAAISDCHGGLAQ